MKTCMFCESDGPFLKIEHIIPEALGNDNLTLKDEVCDKCNQYFGSKIENFVLGKTPFAFWRTYLGVRKKRDKLPHVDLSQPKKQKGILPSVHHLHDNFVGFTYHEDNSISVEIDDDQILKEILSETKNQFRFVFTPLVLSMMGRFLCKIGLELICSDDPEKARTEIFTQSRRFARYGEFKGLWPIFHAQSKSLQDLKHKYTDSEGILSEDVLCYEYSLLDFKGKYTLFALTVGTDTWVVSLNDPFPTPEIQLAFPEIELKLIWYSAEQMKSDIR